MMYQLVVMQELDATSAASIVEYPLADRPAPSLSRTIILQRVMFR
jgi:hypothetical protein